MAAGPRTAPAEAPRSYLRDTIYGAIDGAVTTFAIVAGVAGAGLPPRVILALGVANMLADGFSMAAGNYAGTKAEMEDRARLALRRAARIEADPPAARADLLRMLRGYGFAGSALRQAAQALAADPAAWHRLVAAAGASGEPPLRAALATFVAFVLAGCLPLLPFALGLPDALAVSVVLTGGVFFVIGALRSRWSLAPWWRSGAETLAIGGLAALIAYLVGALFHA